MNMDDLERRFDDWREEREKLSAAEAAGDYPAPDTWAGSDDEAVEILRGLATLLWGEKP